MTEPIDQATKDLIKKEAEEYADGAAIKHTTQHGIRKFSYIAGATIWAEKLKQERNKVIDECIKKVKTLTMMELYENLVINKLQSLKDKSHE